MTTNQNLPKTLLEATEYFANEQTCFEYVKSLRWPDGVVKCAHCDSTHVKLLSNGKIWKCYACKKKFSVRLGTIFTDSALPLKKWLIGFWLVMNAKNGISSYELHRSLGVTQKTAWFLSHRIREVMRTGTIEKLSGISEADEMYIGGEPKNMHTSKRPINHSSALGDKTPVLGIVQRGGRVTASVIDDQTGKSIRREIRKKVEAGSTLYTDQFKPYKSLRSEYSHDTVNHSEKEYVRGNVHTNTIEGFFGLFKRCVKGTYIHLSRFHMDRYLDEQCLRYNLRKSHDGNRFESVTSQITGRHLPYKVLTGKAD